MGDCSFSKAARHSCVTLLSITENMTPVGSFCSKLEWKKYFLEQIIFQSMYLKGNL